MRKNYRIQFTQWGRSCRTEFMTYAQAVKFTKTHQKEQMFPEPIYLEYVELVNGMENVFFTLLANQQEREEYARS